MSKEEYTAAIEDNIKFLKEHLSEGLFRCLWTSHIIAIMKESIKLLYGDAPSELGDTGNKLSKQEIAIAEAAYCVKVMWDEYEGKENFDHMVRLRINHLIRLVRGDYQPSLPSNLDEAAVKAYKEYDVKSAIKPKEYPVGFLFLDGFKSGARWRDAQIPKLPENLDEAAFAYGNRDDITAAQSHAMSIAFKAGVEWIAGQGVTIEGWISRNNYTKKHILHTDISHEALKTLKPGEVIVQIRKK